MDYTQLTDDELRRKVLELMGYRVGQTDTDRYYGLNWTLFYKGVPKISSLCVPVTKNIEESMWQQAPDPLTDANARELLEKELLEIGYRVNTWQTAEDVSVQLINFNDGLVGLAGHRNSVGRAVCEVYCQVKEKANV